MHFKIHVCTKSNLHITTWISFLTNSLYTFLGQKYSTRSILHLIQRWIFSMICWIAFINKKMKQITTISCEYNKVCVLPMDCDVVTTSLTYEKNTTLSQYLLSSIIWLTWNCFAITIFPFLFIIAIHVALYMHFLFSADY